MKLKDVCSLEEKKQPRQLTNLDSILKSREIILSIKVRLVKAMVFPVVMYGCESWTIKKVEYWRIDTFELWCWRRLLRVPWTSGRSNKSILKEISPEFSLEGLLLKSKLQCFGHLIRTANALEKTFMLGKIEGKSRSGHQRMRWLDSITDSMDESEQTLENSGGQKSPECCSPWGPNSQTRLGDWPTTKCQVHWRVLGVASVTPKWMVTSRAVALCGHTIV